MVTSGIEQHNPRRGLLLSARFKDMSTRCVGTPAVGLSADGRLELFVRVLRDDSSKLGELYHRWELTPGGNWSNWHAHGGRLLGDPVVTQNTERRLELFVIAEEGLLQKWQTFPSNGWSDWHFAGRAPTLPFNPHLAIASNADGRLEVFALAWTGRGRIGIYHLWQLAPSRGWSAVTILDVLPVSTPNPLYPVVAPSADGRLELFVIAEGTVYHKWQTATNTTDAWSGWHSHGAIAVVAGHPTVSPAIATNADGRLELFVVAPNSDATGASMQHIWQLTPSGGWSDQDVSAWRTEPGEFLDPSSSSTAARQADARLELCAVGTAGSGGGVMWHKTQTAPNNGWSDWSLLSDAQTLRFDHTKNHPRLMSNAGGILEIFAISKDGSLWHARQLMVNGPWSQWIPLGRPLWINPDDFPMAWWDNAQRTSDHAVGNPLVMMNEGDNLILAYYRCQTPFSDLTDYLDSVRAAGLRAMVEIGTLQIDNGQVPPTFRQGGTQGLIDYIRDLKDRPEVWGWYLYDEPFSDVLPLNRAKAAYQTIKAEDPTRPVAIAFGFNGVPEQYRDAMDVYMVDNYLTLGNNEFDGTAFSGDRFDNGEYFRFLSEKRLNAVGDQRYWVVLQAFSQGQRFPTLAEHRYLTYTAIQAGAQGIFFWIHTATEQSWVNGVFAPVLSEFGRYARAFAHGALVDKASVSNASTTASVFPDPDHHALLLLLIHHGSGGVSTTVTIDTSLQITTVTVPNKDGRSLRLENETFTDSLGPFEVRLYVLY